MRTRLLLILMVVLGAFPAALAATPAEAQIAQCAGAEPTISLSPISGPSGTQVTLRYRNFDPGDPLKVIFRSAGDPVVADCDSGAVGDDDACGAERRQHPASSRRCHREPLPPAAPVSSYAPVRERL